MAQWAYNAGDPGEAGSTPGLGKSPGGEHGKPLHYSFLENPMDRGFWQAVVHGSQRAHKTEATENSREHRESYQ